MYSAEFSGGSLERRSVPEGDSVQKPSNALAMFNLSFSFSLPQEQRTVESAVLLLFQEPVRGDNNYITAVEQFVEITVLQKSGTKAVVASKYLNIFDSGFQTFDLTSAVKNWINDNFNGQVNLEVTVYCFAPSCTVNDNQGREPKSIRFLYNPRPKEHAPRVVVTSKNPLEVQNGGRSKRQSNGGGVSFCVSNQTTCCLKPLRINFEHDLNITFISQPLEFDANYCEGICPTIAGGALMTPRLFEFLKQLEGNPAQSIEPCCVGTVYHTLTVAIRNKDGSELILDLKQVRVTSCRCA